MQVIERFRELSRIGRCSFKGGAMREYLAAEGEKYGYEVAVDDTGNVLCHKKDARMTLQAHYDMVCIGNAPELEIYEEDGWLHAKDSTLGADNGIGMAMMLCLMSEGAPVDCLFTADEEVGLLGARGLDVPLKPVPMLNLDSEEEGIVTIGCAGGVDVSAFKSINRVVKQAHCYRVGIGGLPGGHSGVDIHKNIPNAIKELSALLEEGLELAAFDGGERRNSIPRSAVATVASETELEGREHFEYLGFKDVAVMIEGRDVLEMLRGFEHGVRSMDDALGIVGSSVNLALVATEETAVRVHLSARAMDAGTLRALEAQTAAHFKAYGCGVESEGFYAPWEPERSGFAQAVLETNAAVFENASFGAIHAGLECGVIKERYPEVDMASIGPNIASPHSTAERVETASVARVFEIVKKVVAGC